ncbi:molybdopterin converting factor subunit 1 [Salinithrix halophila]|uniref:Molybdopterin converting factor subunit 1 n=1 Tax=Salinithrix halophila TaxID=1485204 RepID=A0ABV8JER9_9BACL
MKINVLFFAGVAEAVGKRSASLDLPEKTTVRDLSIRLAELYPDAADTIRSSLIALNQEYAGADHMIQPGDEVALIPPVSGGENSEEDWCFVTENPLSPEVLIRRVSNPRAGAVLTFAGTVREFTGDQRTVFLEYEAYAPMAVRKMDQIRQEILKRWPGVHAAIAHRIGKLSIEEISVLIAVASPHRAEAFEAGRYAIERLKETVPIWKKEVWEDGSEWIGAQTGPWNHNKKDTEP